MSTKSPDKIDMIDVAPAQHQEVVGMHHGNEGLLTREPYGPAGSWHPSPILQTLYEDIA